MTRAIPVAGPVISRRGPGRSRNRGGAPARKAAPIRTSGVTQATRSRRRPYTLCYRLSKWRSPLRSPAPEINADRG